MSNKRGEVRFIFLYKKCKTNENKYKYIIENLNEIDSTKHILIKRSNHAYQVPKELDPPTGITYGFLPSFSNFSFRISASA